MNSNPVNKQSYRVSILWICLVLLVVSFFQYFDVLHWSVLTPWGPDIVNCSIRPHDTSVFWAQCFGPFLHGNLEHFLGNFSFIRSFYRAIPQSLVDILGSSTYTFSPTALAYRVTSFLTYWRIIVGVCIFLFLDYHGGDSSR